ncbi:MAG: GDP-mannose 4,6-dehydratase [Candidatus Cloacimonetes bacterium]|jgi:UDP-glucuronate 4-epimerase|nr:GDP-mannose 4,6-dehydratase [Candidatus Cloacimonadota bacterium]
MKILVTGAAGFIGSHLCEALVKEHDVIGIDNFCDFYDIKIKRNNIKGLGRCDNFQIIKADIRSKDELEDVFSHHKFDLIIHLAAMAGVRPSIADPVLYTEVNVNGTVNLLEQCKKQNIKKFIFASSSSVYGNNKKIPFAESDPVDLPISPYAATKKAGELICHTYHHLEQISMVVLRFFTVYGPRQRPDLAIHKFARKIMADEVIPVFGDGSTQRDYTYIDDVIDGILRSIDFVSDGCRYELFNLGESQTISLSKMIKTIEKALRKIARKEILPLQPGDVDKTFADISKAKKMLGYDPKTKFVEGVNKFVEWLRDN